MNVFYMTNDTLVNYLNLNLNLNISDEIPILSRYHVVVFW